MEVVIENASQPNNREISEFVVFFDLPLFETELRQPEINYGTPFGPPV